MMFWSKGKQDHTRSVIGARRQGIEVYSEEWHAAKVGDGNRGLGSVG